MNQRTLVMYLYLLNLALLATHEIDAAYWQEWRLFGLPGGIEAFLVLNLLALLIALLGFRWLSLARRSGDWLSMFLGGAGVAAFTVHMVFIVTGRPEFALPTSLALLALILIVSVAQLLTTISLLHCPKNGARIN